MYVCAAMVEPIKRHSTTTYRRSRGLLSLSPSGDMFPGGAGAFNPAGGRGGGGGGSRPGFVPPLLGKALAGPPAAAPGAAAAAAPPAAQPDGPLSERTLRLLARPDGSLPEPLARLDPVSLETICNEVMDGWVGVGQSCIREQNGLRHAQQERMLET